MARWTHFVIRHRKRVLLAWLAVLVLGGIAAFSGFLAGSFVWSQEFGTGLAAAILLDATIVRAMLVPATMKLLGDWNWYLPERVRRVLRLPSRRQPATAGGRG